MFWLFFSRDTWQPRSDPVLSVIILGLEGTRKFLSFGYSDYNTWITKIKNFPEPDKVSFMKGGV